MIYTILVFTKLEKNKYGFSDFGEERLVGYYRDINKAFMNVKNNSCDIFETCYHYALIEEVEQGLYNPAINRWLFKFNIESGKYEQIEESDFMKHECGYTIG